MLERRGRGKREKVLFLVLLLEKCGVKVKTSSAKCSPEEEQVGENLFQDFFAFLHIQKLLFVNRKNLFSRLLKHLPRKCGTAVHEEARRTIPLFMWKLEASGTRRRKSFLQFYNSSNYVFLMRFSEEIKVEVG